MILFCFISLLGTASAEEIIGDNIASNDASIDIDVIESPIHEGISISTVENSDVATDDSSSVNGSASKGKLTANQLGASHDLSGSTLAEIQAYLDSGSVQQEIQYIWAIKPGVPDLGLHGILLMLLMSILLI